MSKTEFEMGSVCLGNAGFVASWWRCPPENGVGYRRQPQVNIFEAAASDENVYIPATSLTINGAKALRALRAVIDEALLNEPDEKSK